MLSTLPNFLVILLLAVLGAVVGAAINWAIYSWCYFSRRPFSPWMRCEDPPLVRTKLDRTPILGWFSLRRHVKELGSAFWIRPLLIEITWAIGLPWFWFWQSGPGLTGGVAVPSLWIETWFWGHSVLIALMFVATFIDFDEKTIPDEITLPGTLFALAMAAAFPWFRLPELVNRLAGPAVEPIHYGSSNALPAWHHGYDRNRDRVNDCPDLVFLAAAGSLHNAIRSDPRHSDHVGQYDSSETQNELLDSNNRSAAAGTDSIDNSDLASRLCTGAAGLATTSDTPLDQSVRLDRWARIRRRHGLVDSHCRQLRHAAGSHGIRRRDADGHGRCFFRLAVFSVGIRHRSFCRFGGGLRDGTAAKGQRDRVWAVSMHRRPSAFVWLEPHLEQHDSQAVLHGARPAGCAAGRPGSHGGHAGRNPVCQKYFRGR